MWEALLAAAAQAAMKKIQEKQSGALQQETISGAQQAFAEAEMGEDVTAPTMQPKSGMLGDIAKSFITGQVMGAVMPTKGADPTAEFGAAPGTTFGTPELYGAPPDRASFLESVGLDQVKLQDLFKRIEPKFAVMFNALIDSILKQQKGGVK